MSTEGSMSLGEQWTKREGDAWPRRLGEKDRGVMPHHVKALLGESELVRI